MDKDTIKTAAESAAEYTQRQPWPAWIKFLLTALIGAAAAVACMTLTSCSITPEQASQLQSADTLIRAAAPYIITISHRK